MNFFKFLSTTVITTSLLCTPIFCNQAPSFYAYDLTPQDIINYQGKKLICNESSLLDSVFKMFPTGLLRLNIAAEEALKVFKILQQNATMNDTTLATSLKNMLTPAKKFITTITKYSDYIYPILTESLQKNPATPRDYLLVRFFKAGKIDVDTFFSTNVTTASALALVCSEFLIFSQDMNANLSPETKEAYEKVALAWEKIKSNSKNPK